MDQVSTYGLDWLHESWKMVREDKAEYYRFLMSLAPLHRTSMDKKDAQAMNRYGKQVEKYIKGMTPWNSGAASRLGNLRGKVTPGQTVVVLSGEETGKDPLFKKAKVTRE